jgi:hypothetical protein
MNKQLFLILIFLTSFSSLFSQSKAREALDVISTSGSSIESEKIVISWTIGNNIIDFLQIEDAQSPRPEDKPGVMEMEDGTLIKVYPTLTTGPVIIKVRAVETTQLNAEFLDLKGTKLKIIKLDTDEVEVDLSNFKNGMYIIKITNKDVTDQKLVKIVKL